MGCIPLCHIAIANPGHNVWLYAGLRYFIDDFIITLMVAGGVQHPAAYIYSMIRTGVTPEVNAVSTLLLAVSIIWLAYTGCFPRPTAEVKPSDNQLSEA